MDRQNAIAFRKDLERAIEKLGAKYGVAITVGSVSYNSTSCKVSVQAIDKGSTFDDEYSIGDRFRGKDNAVYELISYNTRAKNYPYVIKDLDLGKKYKTTAAALANMEKI